MLVVQLVAMGCGARTGLPVETGDAGAGMGGPARDAGSGVMINCSADIPVVVFRGRWQIEVAGSEAGFQQRIVICGSDRADGAHRGVLGAAFPVDGDEWYMSIEHNDGSGWIASSLRQIRVSVPGASEAWRVESEDGVDNDYDDLVLLITRE